MSDAGVHLLPLFILFFNDMLVHLMLESSTPLSHYKVRVHFSTQAINYRTGHSKWTWWTVGTHRLFPWATTILQHTEACFTVSPAPTSSRWNAWGHRRWIMSAERHSTSEAQGEVFRDGLPSTTLNIESWAHLIIYQSNWSSVQTSACTMFSVSLVKKQGVSCC